MGFIPLDKLTKMARTVPENILKKQARDKVLQDATIKRRAEAKAKRVESRKTFAANAEKYANEYAATEVATIKAKRDAKKAGNFYVEPEAKIAFVIRTRGINKLRMVEPFVTYGYPSRSTVQRLVYKRGCGKI